MKIKSKKAISLIVLVITILVLSILATSVIVSLSNANIIEEASDAVKKTEAQQIEEMKSFMFAEGIMGNNPEPVTIGSITLVWNGEKEEVHTTYDGVVIPAGFYYVGGTKDTGLIISDDASDENKGEKYICTGNQFVWVPVEYEIEEGEVPDATTGLYESFTDVFKRGTAEETYEGSGIYKMTGALSGGYVNAEPVTTNLGGYEEEIEEYYKMCSSVQYYHGFYIGRFESGDGDATDGTKENRTESTEEHRVVIKKGAVVYNYVPWGAAMNDIYPEETDTGKGIAGAVYLSQNMYSNHKSVVSTLCYGVQWDTALNFVSDKEHDITNSVKWGNFRYSEGAANDFCYSLNVCGKNEAWQAKNIYDLAGNVREWTMEYSPSIGKRSQRGGYFGHVWGAYGSASDRYGGYKEGVGNSYDSCGFRVTLYLK